MNLTVVIDEMPHELQFPDQLLHEAQDFFRKIDGDMDGGWQMGRAWVEKPGEVQRCQIAADKLLTALETENKNLALLMSAYIVWRMPGIRGVEVDTTGDVTATELLMDTPAEEPAPARPTAPPRKSITSRMDAVEQAGVDISPVYKSGRGYRFARYDHDARRWQESELVQDREEAVELRMRIYEKRLQELIDEIEA